MPILFYSDPQDNRVNVTLGALKDLKPDDLGINTVFKIEKEDKKAFVDTTSHVDIKGNFNGATYTLPDGEGRTVQIKAYEQGNYANADEVRAANRVYEENALNGVKINVNQFYEGLDNDQKGSLFSDLAWASFTEGKSTGNKFRPGMKERFDELLNNPDLGLSDEDKKYIEKQILEGTYSGSDEQISGMDVLSQNVLSNQAFDNNFVKVPQEGVKQLSQDEMDRQRIRDEAAETSLKINKEKLEDEGDGEATDLLDYFSQDTGPLGFGGKDTKAKNATRVVNSMVNNGFFNANGNFKTTGEIIRTIRETQDQSVFGYDVTDERQFKNFRTAGEINDIIPVMKKAVESTKGGEPLTDQDMSALNDFGFSQTDFNNIQARKNMAKFVKHFEKFGIDGTNALFNKPDVNSYFEFDEANRGGFTTNNTPGKDDYYKDGGNASTTAILQALPLTITSNLSRETVGEIVKEAYSKTGLYKYLKFN